MRNFAVAAVVVLAAACSHQQRSARSSQNLSMQNAPPSAVAAAPQERTFRCVPMAERQPVSGQAQCVPIERQNVAGREAACPIVRVHFGFDDDQLTAAAKATIRRNADCFRRGALSLNIEGNADERGPEAYNQDLGERRAHSVALYLESLGVPASDLHAISYGKDRPLCLGHTESCWQQNRRVTLRPGNLTASTPRTVQ